MTHLVILLASNVGVIYISASANISQTPKEHTNIKISIFISHASHFRFELLTRCVRHLYDTFFLEYFKGIFRDHSRDNALNFHKIQDFCILVMVLDV